MKMFKGLIVSLVILFAAGIFIINETNAQGKAYKIGDRGPAGGLVFYDKGSSTNGWQYMEAMPLDQVEAPWGCTGESVAGADGKESGKGKTNTQAIIKGCRDGDTAAKKASAYRGGGKSDWFLPSKEELNSIYINLYSAGIGDIENSLYWSSSEDSANNAWIQKFSYGLQLSTIKNYKLRVIAVRSF